jgi:hypothetical protein
MKRFDGEREIFRLLEAVRCLEYVFGTGLRPVLEQVRMGLYAGSPVACREDAVAEAAQDVGAFLRNRGYIPPDPAPGKAP